MSAGTKSAARAPWYAPFVTAAGGFFGLSFAAGRCLFRRPFYWREALDQAWFLVTVALLPTILVALPFTVLVIFTLNVLLVEFGAADLSGAGAALGSVTQIGPLVTVLIVAGAGATAALSAFDHLIRTPSAV